jgi:hypothetical protein
MTTMGRPAAAEPAEIGTASGSTTAAADRVGSQQMNCLVAMKTRGLGIHRDQRVGAGDRERCRTRLRRVYAAAGKVADVEPPQLSKTLNMCCRIACDAASLFAFSLETCSSPAAISSKA